MRASRSLRNKAPLTPEIDLPEWMLLCLRHYSISGKLVRQTAETTIPHLPAERFREILFPFPPLEEQKEMSNRVECLDRERREILNRLDGLRNIRERLMEGKVFKR